MDDDYNNNQDIVYRLKRPVKLGYLKPSVDYWKRAKLAIFTFKTPRESRCLRKILNKYPQLELSLDKWNDFGCNLTRGSRRWLKKLRLEQKPWELGLAWKRTTERNVREKGKVGK